MLPAAYSQSGWTSLATYLALLLATPLANSAPLSSHILPSTEPGWAQFRGPFRDGVCRETGLLKSWPDGGPSLVWKRENIGRGYSSPILAGDTICITGDVGEDLVLFALNLDGTLKWQEGNGRSWQGPYPGSRACCTFKGGQLYQMNAHGRLVCLDPVDGRELWAVNILERFGADNIHWGLSECLLIDGEKLIVTPGGPQTLMAALDRKNGETIWETGPLRFTRTEEAGGRKLDSPREDCDKAGYASPILFQLGTRRLIAGCSARHLFLVDPDRAKLLCTYPVEPARWEVIGTMPVLWRDRLIFSAPDFGTHCFRIDAETADKVSLVPVWDARTDNCHGGLVVSGDDLFGAGYRRSRDWVCIDLDSGQTRYNHPNLVKGAVLFADERLYALAENGTMALLKPGSGAFETAGRFDLPRGSLSGTRQNDVWAHPVIHGGKLYLRNHDILLCYDVRDPSAPAIHRR